jgi:hypothetical protein
MNITPDKIAKLIYHTSNLRYYERDYASDKEQDLKVEIAIVRIREEIDTLLKELGLDDFFDLHTLTEILKINLENFKLKQAV